MEQPTRLVDASQALRSFRALRLPLGRGNHSKTAASLPARNAVAGAERRGTESGGELGPSTSPAPIVLADWLASLPWDARLDLTFRVGAEGCEVREISPERARRRLVAFLRRLVAFYGRPVLVFAAPELQGRGVLHWHALLRWEGGAPWLRHRELTNIWQYWKRWKRIPHSQGVEGHLWLVLVRKRSHAKYAVKYAAKSPRDWLLMHVEALPSSRGSQRVKARCLQTGQLVMWCQGKSGGGEHGGG